MHIKFCSARIALCIAITFSRPQLITHKRLETAREYAPSTTLSSIMPRVRGSAVANGKLDGPSLPAKGKDKGQDTANTPLGEEKTSLPVITEKAKATNTNDEKEKDAQSWPTGNLSIRNEDDWPRRRQYLLGGSGEGGKPPSGYCEESLLCRQARGTA